MKKALSVVLAAAMMAVVFAGCGSSGGGQTAAAPKETKVAETQAAQATQPAATEAAKPDKVYKWKFASIYANPEVNTEFNSIPIAQKKFCDMITERSGGRLEVQPFFDGTLGTSNELYEQCQNGELEIYMGQPMSNYDPRYAAWSIPYLFNNYADVKKVMCDQDSEAFKMSKEWLADNGLVLEAIGSGSIRGFLNSKKPVHVVGDVNGLKVRSYQDPIVTGFWSNICNATPLAMSEVYTSLQTSAVDGMEFCCVNVIGQKLYEVTKYFSDINWQWCSGAMFLVSQKALDELPEDLQQIVHDCAKECMDWQMEQEMKDYDAAIDKLTEEGIECYSLTDEERQTWIDYAESTYAATREFIGADTYDAFMKAVEDGKAK